MSGTTFPFFRERATEGEILDQEVADPDEARRSLDDIRFVNRWLGGRRVLLEAVRPYLQPGGRLLDVGCGSGDLPAFLAWRIPSAALAVGLDRKLLHVREAPLPVRALVADVRALPFGPRAFDVVTASLFLHHFDAPELPGVLRALYGLCRKALVVNDLHRSAVAWGFAATVFPFVFRSRISVSDGLLSIRRGFRPRELAAAFAAAGLPGVRIERRFPYRLVAVAEA